MFWLMLQFPVHSNAVCHCGSHFYTNPNLILLVILAISLVASHSFNFPTPIRSGWGAGERGMLEDPWLNLLLVVLHGPPIASGGRGGSATPSISVKADGVGLNVINTGGGRAGGISVVVTIPHQAALYCSNLALDAGSLGYSILTCCVSSAMVSGDNARLIVKGVWPST